MRAVLVGLLGFLVFWLFWPLVQVALLGPERAGNSPQPSLSVGYSQWLLSILIAAVVAGLVARALWRLMSR